MMVTNICVNSIIALHFQLLFLFFYHANCYISDVLVFTVASNETDGFQRYLRSVEIYRFRDNLRILGLGEPWRGGNVVRYAGGGYKINLLKKALEKYRNDEKKIILFTDRLIHHNIVKKNIF